LFGGVEVELLFFLGEEFAFEGEALCEPLLFEADQVNAMGDAREGAETFLNTMTIIKC
jgi:hypothetical protein